MLFDKDQKRELIRENQQLKRQLQKAKGLISSLYREIDELKAQLSKVEKDKIPKTPKTSKMNLEECFDNSSEEEQKDQNTGIIESEDNNSSCSPKVRFKTDNLNLSSSVEKSPGHLQMRKAYTKIILNSQQCVPRKSIQKLLKKSSQRRKQQAFYDSFSIKAVSTRQIQMPMPVFRREISSVRSQKVLFKKTSNQKSIFQHFFVTGLGKGGPSILYSYPPESGMDFSGYLALIYGQNYLRHPDLSPCNSRSKISPNAYLREPMQQQSFKRECYVIPILKSKGQSSERDYLIICESQEQIMDKNESMYFTRSYCFLTQWKFFSEFRKLTSVMIDNLQARKKNKSLQQQSQLGVMISEEFGPSLAFLHQKSTDYNKTIDCCIGESGLRFSADVPPLESSFQLVDKFLTSRLNTIEAHIKMGEEDGFETKMLGLLLTYALAQTKIVLYSASKVKVSQTVLELLELIKPLSYVNPVIVGALRDEHQTYLDAPMGLILGLWAESRRSNKQKIQIFMNKKLNLSGLIEKAKLSINDGIVINLDTGLVFGGGLNPQLNSIALKLNSLGFWSKNTKNMREYYKFVERMLAGRGQSQQTRTIWTELMVYIRNTQLYCYYLQNKD